MAKRAGKWARVFIDGYNLTTKTSNIAPDRQHDEVEVSGYTQDKNYLAGQGDGQITLDGFFDAETGATHAALKELASGLNSALVTAAFGSNAAPTVGDPVFCLNANQMSYTTTADKAGAIAVNANFRATGTPLEMGVLLLDTTVSSDGNGSAVNNGAASSNGGAAYFHIMGLSAGDTLEITVTAGTDGNTFGTTLATCTLDGSAIGAERITFTGAVPQYVRAEYDVTGTDVSFPIAVAFIRS